MSTTTTFTAPDLATLIPACHEASKANGWWNPAPNQGQQLMLVVSELSEALEAHRTGKRANLDKFNRWMAENPKVLDETGIEGYMASCFRDTIKDSVEDELADAYIRLLDFAGGFGLNAAKIIESEGTWGGRYFSLDENFGAALLEITKGVCGIDDQLVDNDRASEILGCTLCEINELCQREGIDLARHIDLKLAYNKTRGQKHGGKLY